MSRAYVVCRAAANVVLALSYLTWLAIDTPSATSVAPVYAVTTGVLSLLNVLAYVRRNNGG